MAHLNSLVSTVALAVSATSVGLLGCSADPGGQGPGTTPLGTPGYLGTGGSPAPVVGAGTGGSGAVGNTGFPPTPTTTGAPPPPPTTTAPPPPTNTVPPSFGGAPAGGAPSMGAGGAPAGGAPAGGATGAAGSGNTGTWDPNKALDAMGKLIVPAQGQGFQLKTPTFTLNPGQEVFSCWRISTPNTDTFAVGEWDSQMAKGSHHFILYRADSDSSATPQGVLSMSGCTQGFGGSTWLYTGGSPRGHLQMPDGVAMTIKAQQRLDFDMHYINTGTEPLTAGIALNVNKVQAAMYQVADAQISFNIGINVPPHGTQTVSGTCTPPPGANYFLLQTHMHHHGTLATIGRILANGMKGEEIVRTTNWDSPEVKLWQQPPFLTLQSGEKFSYSCSYQNDTNTAVTVGTSAEYNEMCMMEGYFFPASATTPTCN